MGLSMRLGRETEHEARDGTEHGARVRLSMRLWWD